MVSKRDSKIVWKMNEKFFILFIKDVSPESETNFKKLEKKNAKRNDETVFTQSKRNARAKRMFSVAFPYSSCAENV